MAPPLSPTDAREAQRLAKLASFAILDTPPEREFDTIVSLAQRLLGCPIALVSLVDDHRQWFKARCGLDATGTPRDQAFCAHAIQMPDIMVVEDATRDPRFADNPLVTGGPRIRFYAGVPLRPAAQGFPEELAGVGTLCVIDVVPRMLDDAELDTLRRLAGLVCALIRARVAAANERAASDEVRASLTVLDRQHRQLRQAERMAGIGSWRLDLADQSVEWSDQVYAIHGLPAGEMPSLAEALSFYPEDRREEIATILSRGASHGEAFDFESDFVTADGRARRVRTMGEPQWIEDRPVALIGVFQDVTERHVREQSLRRSADTDALTGLANRAAFEAHLTGAIAHARVTGDPLALLLLDLDGFKGVNDSFGHEAGDEVLRTVAARLGEKPFRHGFAARLGGDEFVVLVTRPRDCAEIGRYVETCLEALRQDVVRGGAHRTVSATIGAALLDDAIATPADLLRRADLALYEAKRAERGTGRVFGGPVAVRAAA